MAAVLTEPDAAKAVTTGATGEMVHFSFPIEKTEDTAAINPVDGTPDIEIAGKCTDGTIDSDLQIVDPDASLRWIKTWYDTKANIRMGHDPKRPVGKGLQVDGHHIRALIADPVAKHLIRQKILNDFSVGIMNPEIRRGDPRFKHLDPMGKAINGVITDRDDGLTGLGEISVVDRGSNFGSAFTLVKAAADGSPEWVGKMTGGPQVAEDAEPAATKGVTVTLPKNMSLSVKPSDLAKLATFKQKLVAKQAPGGVTAGAVVPATVGEGGHNPAGEALLKEIFTGGGDDGAEAVVYKRDIDTATRRRLASENRALPDLSYPIENHEDAHNAATLALSGHGNVSAAKKLIKRIASKEGWTDVLDRLKGGKKKKVATPAAEKKMKVMCPSCGAKQNKKHAACSECGRPLANAMAAKNHDFACLSCGNDPLDKGEKFCPGCGTANPGYNPMADKKIPVNEDKTAAPAVVKAKKKKKPKKAKGKPFGDSQAPPFGKDKDPKDDGDDSGDGKDKPAGKAARVTAVAKGSQSKGKGKKGGKKPTPASAGGVPGSHTDPVPAHREPDGGAVEAFEADAGLEDGDGMEAQSKVPVMAGVKSTDPEMAASLALKALDIPADLGALHALTCPAYAPADVGKAFPYAAFSGIDEGWWQGEALSKAASAPLGEATAAMDLWNDARALKQADPYLTQDLRENAHKAFRDANPGPSSFPTPGELSPQRFNRPLISEGHEAPSPGHDAPHSVRLPQSGGIVAASYQRGYLDAGHASDGPENQHTPGPVAPPASTGMPTHDPAQGYVTHMAHDSASHAIGAMHDHISRIFPDVCPMNPGDNDFRNPVPSPTGGVTPAPGARKAAKAKVKKAAAKAKRKAAAKAKKVEKARKAREIRLARKVLKGALDVDIARAKLGLEPAPAANAVIKTAAAEPPPDVPTMDPATFKALVKPLTRKLARLEKAQRRTQKTADAIASQPDTTGAPFRGVALNKTSAPPVEAPTPAGTAEQAQLHKMRLLQNEALNSNDPSARIAAWAELDRMLGIAPGTNPQYTPLRQ